MRFLTVILAVILSACSSAEITNTVNNGNTSYGMRNNQLTAYDTEKKEKIFNVKLSDTKQYVGLAATKKAVFASLQDGKILAINPDDGKIIWENSVESEVRSAPVADSENIYVQTQNNNIYKFNQKTGKKELIFASLGEQLNYPFAASPAIYGNNIIAGLTTGNIYSIKKNGEVNWKAKAYSSPKSRTPTFEKAILSTPKIDGNSVYVSSLNSIGRYSLSAGKTIWQRDICSSKSPEISKDTVLVLDDENTLHTLDKANGKTLRTEKK